MLSRLRSDELLEAGLLLYTSLQGRVMAFNLVSSPTNKMLKALLCSLAFLSLTNTNISLAQQQTTPPPSNQAGLPELIRSASLRTGEYRAKFKDLSAEEQQKIEEYDSEGKLKRQRLVTSDLIIYQSQLDTSLAAEYRNVRTVDGKAVAKREERLMNLFNRLAKADSVKKELDRINRESQRYDLAVSFHGLTLNEGLLLDESEQAFQFSIVGSEQLNGRAVIVLQYQQVAQSPGLTTKLSLPSVLKGAEPLYRGRMWLDAETAQLWREEREFTLRHPSVAAPLVFIRFEFEYAGSRFGILTPQRIVVSTFSNGRMGADKMPQLLLGGKVTFEYSSFTRFEVGAPDASVKPAIVP
jgi:hypothetical protein